MKKFLSLLLVIILIFSLTACSNASENNDDNATKIKFSQTIEDLKKLDGKKVTITGFMSLLSPLNGSLIYLMNIPYQSCPFCIPNTTTLANTIAVKGENIELTALPVKITGTLVFGKFSDSYGYEYDYRIENAQIEKLSEEEVSEQAKVYYTVAQGGYLDEIAFVIDCITQVGYYEEMGIDPKTFSSNGDIPFEIYSTAKSTIEKLNQNGEYDSFLTLLNKTETVRTNINKDLAANNIDAYKSYASVSDELYELFNAFINEYEF